ncbi:PEPxxWA-CTERM sorting domain-containing protein [Phenylobacterium sp.]|uniref:PEPxxWA-CTERM sorting domain-containing protein n=1 Tax=Phenylobacterium sp. TaxID=1871053 RepID=UPI0012270D06|nr:PEPxxWA-CTERM sorting domain-containing protein [Phenylobacterium sp.]THD58671.1 MAG: PEP-CTERM sorting domain-containing protein [Phenylobacterium sp.]
MAAVSAVALTAAASGAQAQSATNASLAAPGVYFGTGNPNGAFATDTAGGIEIGLRSKISGVHPQITPVGDVYSIPLGDTFNFDYSFNPSVGAGEVDADGLTQSITVTDAFGFSVSFDPSAIGDNATNAGAPGGFQNSEKISFSFLDPAYNPNKNDTFTITYSVFGIDHPSLSVENVVNVGSGAPEPAAWALMILGFGGVGATLRRKVRTAATAA